MVIFQTDSIRSVEQNEDTINFENLTQHFVFSSSQNFFSFLSMFDLRTYKSFVNVCITREQKIKNLLY